MDRRSFLAASLTGVTALSAGCLNILPNQAENEEESYEFSLFNGSEETHTFRVQFGDSLDGGSFYDETFELGGEKAEENIAIEQTPVSIILTIDSTIERMYSWPASSAEPGTVATVAEIWYEPDRDQEIYIWG